MLHKVEIYRWEKVWLWRQRTPVRSPAQTLGEGEGRRKLFKGGYGVPDMHFAFVLAKHKPGLEATNGVSSVKIS